MKILFCGDINSGKSTIIEKLIKDMKVSPKGYITVRMPPVDGVSHVHLYDIANPPERVEDAPVIIELCKGKRVKRPELLESLGVEYLKDIPEGSTVVLDEIGTLESACPEFQKALFKILDGNYNVLGSVKAQNTELLRRVRKHPDCDLFIITPDNRNELYEQVKREYGI